MRDSLRIESEKLRRSWMQHDSEWLREYMVASVEDPRINLQSIFSRHFLLRSALWKTASPVPAESLDLVMEHECRFSAVMNWLLMVLVETRTSEDLQDLLHALKTGVDNTEAVRIPQFVLQTFKLLPTEIEGIEIPNYLEDSIAGSGVADGEVQVAKAPLNTFVQVWRQAMTRFEGSAMLSVLEPACGSANDYRLIEATGISKLLKYTGMDLCEKNVENARALFPTVDFRVGNAFQIEAADRAYDACFFHDLLEHLSLEGLERAIEELCRVTNYSICAGFFQLHDMPDHIVRQTEDYHLNTLSLEKTRELFEAQGFSATVLHVSSFLRQHFGCNYTHNPNACTLVLTRKLHG